MAQPRIFPIEDSSIFVEMSNGWRMYFTSEFRRMTFLKKLDGMREAVYHRIRKIYSVPIADAEVLTELKTYELVECGRWNIKDEEGKPIWRETLRLSGLIKTEKP